VSFSPITTAARWRTRCLLTSHYNGRHHRPPAAGCCLMPSRAPPLLDWQPATGLTEPACPPSGRKCVLSCRESASLAAALCLPMAPLKHAAGWSAAACCCGRRCLAHRPRVRAGCSGSDFERARPGGERSADFEASINSPAVGFVHPVVYEGQRLQAFAFSPGMV